MRRTSKRKPQWWQGRIYFVSDRDGSMNLWCMNENGGDLRQLTHHRDWDVKSPALSQGRIVYQLGPDLRLYDIAANTDELIPITLASDFDQQRERWIKNPGGISDRRSFITQWRPRRVDCARRNLCRSGRTRSVR